MGKADPRRPLAIDDSLRAEFAALGVEVKSRGHEDELLQIWDIHEQAWRAFLALATQWRVASLATLERARLVRLGLDYAAIPPVLALLGIRKDRQRIFAQLTVLEHAALVAFAEAQS